MADDMTNPLELALDLPDHATLEDLARRVVAADFLQFSSTHHTLTGFAGSSDTEPALLTSHAALFGGQRVRYLAASDLGLLALLPDGRFTLVFQLH